MHGSIIDTSDWQHSQRDAAFEAALLRAPAGPAERRLDRQLDALDAEADLRALAERRAFISAFTESCCG